MLALNVLVQ